MDGEQTWPTEEEMAEAEEHIKRVKRVPAGMSDYQAAWIPDCDAGIFQTNFTYYKNNTKLMNSANRKERQICGCLLQ